MENLAKQVKQEMLRTAMWATISLGISVVVYYIIW